ncbi:family 43 glycosylhydrolase [Bifidobacterium sp. SO4]|uniref:family 43 glycosylhydrolase n=1 Tax=Bifidobacterium sp. SO4 TaxID=2809030 RepID=UPI001BDD3043|nr:family 43 glycosylhydrolase [Bifidobacterium sp. SO4]MBT1170643.1 family 43 glycosylhydrolase [Bifidobacterium sp. SO4]
MNDRFNLPAPEHTPLHRYLADPAPIVFEDPRNGNQPRYFLYATEDGYDDWGSRTFRVYTSDDLVDWQDGGQILSLDDVPWGKEHAWAPAILKHGARYYLYFVCEGQIGAASSDSPYGPFVPADQPTVAKDDLPGYHIDPSVYTDDEGTDWLVWGNGIAYMAPLNEDHLTVDLSRVWQWTPTRFREAMWIFKRNYMFYASWSENDAREPEYQVHYATAPALHGPWTEHGALVRQNPALDIVGTGHHGILHIPGTDEWILAYHCYDPGYGNGYCRETRFAPLTFNEDGTIQEVIPVQEDYRRPL